MTEGQSQGLVSFEILAHEFLPEEGMELVPREIYKPRGVTLKGSVCQPLPCVDSENPRRFDPPLLLAVWGAVGKTVRLPARQLWEGCQVGLDERV